MAESVEFTREGHIVEAESFMTEWLHMFMAETGVRASEIILIETEFPDGLSKTRLRRFALRQERDMEPISVLHDQYGLSSRVLKQVVGLHEGIRRMGDLFRYMGSLGADSDAPIGPQTNVLLKEAMQRWARSEKVPNGR